ncbi:unnamed protein product [Spirodela intermedia]|uniref:Glucose-methanol-choline oxidoreductase N-terminal domain-containing protein n=1 Tax=Spirodela intermedia TaxID=51605 RepID=A0A7I8J8Q6_SPIIN|nr:unnamed protein product [Spirodela intermedia]CAA6666145.1 unnamed protein product [Spirodela intermedia]
MASKGESFFLRTLLLLVALGSSQGKEFDGYREASTFPSTAPAKGYDYIIVGGGTAGCPLAATLSQNFSVLVLERGGAPYGNVNVSYMQNFHISLADTSPYSASQAFVSTDGVINARARVLGGGTCINAGFYTRANARFLAQAGWDAELVNESYPWVEKQIVRWPALVAWQRALRDGLLEAGISPFNGYTYDHLYGTKVGGTIFNKDGYRHTAADLLSSGNRRNLHVLVHATVHRIVFDRSGRRPRAVGVVFYDEHGVRHRAFLKKRKNSEVILSAGAIGSPQMLLLSGIGPKSHLRKMNISVVLHNKFVGKGIKKPVEQSLIQTVGITKGGSFIEASSGFGQSPDSIKRHHGIMSAERGHSGVHQRKEGPPTRGLPRGFLLEKIVGPLSRGHLALVNVDPSSNPAVTFNYFSHPEDLRRCVYGVRTMAKIARTKHYADLAVDKFTMEMLLNMTVKANVNLIPKHVNDTSSLEQFCRDTVITIWHYHGGCHVGQVVDSAHRVLGVSRLRVVDGSTFATSPGTNPQGTVMMMGRYMGVKLLRKRLGRGAMV